jgi:hypothetical protein
MIKTSFHLVLLAYPYSGPCDKSDLDFGLERIATELGRIPHQLPPAYLVRVLCHTAGSMTTHNTNWLSADLIRGCRNAPLAPMYADQIGGVVADERGHRSILEQWEHYYVY